MPCLLTWCIGNPQSPLDPVRSVIENLGGQIESIYYVCGDYDIVAIRD